MDGNSLGWRRHIAAGLRRSKEHIKKYACLYLFEYLLVFPAFPAPDRAVSTPLVLDQPDLLAPARGRRVRFGEAVGSGQITILNGRGRFYEGGTESTNLSLKWMSEGSADYESASRTFRLAGDHQLLLNPGEPYRLRFREASESFTIFYPRSLADAAWAQLVGKVAAIPEFPTLAARSPGVLQFHLTSLHREAKED